MGWVYTYSEPKLPYAVSLTAKHGPQQRYRVHRVMLIALRWEHGVFQRGHLYYGCGATHSSVGVQMAAEPHLLGDREHWCERCGLLATWPLGGAIDGLVYEALQPAAGGSMLAAPAPHYP